MNFKLDLFLGQPIKSISLHSVGAIFIEGDDFKVKIDSEDPKRLREFWNKLGQIEEVKKPRCPFYCDDRVCEE